MDIKINKYNLKKFNFQKFLSLKFFKNSFIDPEINIRLKKISKTNLEAEIKKINSSSKFLNLYKKFIREEIANKFNYKICYQKRPNIRVFHYNDPNNMVPFHSDSWYNHSKNETNFWLPFHNVNSSESLQIINLKKSKFLEKKIIEKKIDYERINLILKKNAEPAKLKYGHFLTFTPFHIHGNVLNETKYSRISMDFRVTKYNSDFEKKKLGGYFEVL